jgi:Spy/CpxP family protein refolding chaperone
MKICIFAAGFLLMAGFILAAEGGSPFDGKWSGQYDSGTGDPQTLTYVFKTSGNTVTGTVMSSMDSKETPIKDGKIDGNNISFGADVDAQGMTLKYKSKGVLSGEEIKLTFDTDSGGGAPGGGMGGFGGMGGPGGGALGGGMGGFGGMGGPGGGAPGGGMGGFGGMGGPGGGAPGGGMGGFGGMGGPGGGAPGGGMGGFGGMGGPGGGAPGGTGLTQDQTQKINDAVQSDISALNTKLQDAQKAAITAALDKDATTESIKAKVDTVVKIQADIAMLRYTKGVKLIATAITDDQKSQLKDNAARGYQQLFSGGPGGGAPGGAPGGGMGGFGGMMGGFGGMGGPGGGMGAPGGGMGGFGGMGMGGAPGGSQSGSITLKKVK